MKKFIKQKLHEHWGWDEPKVETPLSSDLEVIENSGYDIYQIQQALEDLENKYVSHYGEYDGDTYGVIDAMKKVMPRRLARIYNDMHPTISNEQINIAENEPELTFNDGSFNKNGANTIYMDGNPIVDFGVGGLGNIEIDGETIPNALMLKGGYNASEQGKGYGGMGLKFIFKKLPKVQNILLQCFDTACPFWVKMGGQEVSVKEMPSGHVLRTLRISRDSFE
jgi:hypothetical protein